MTNVHGIRQLSRAKELIIKLKIGNQNTEGKRNCRLSSVLPELVRAAVEINTTQEEQLNKLAFPVSTLSILHYPRHVLYRITLLWHFHVLSQRTLR